MRGAKTLSAYLTGLTQIGFYILDRPTVFTRHYECAAWYTNVTVPAGKYPLYAKVKDGVVQSGHDSVRVELPGVISGSDFTSRLGASHGRPQVNEDVGKKEVYRLSSAAYTIAQVILTGANQYYDLFPEFLPQITSFEHLWHDSQNNQYTVSAGYTYRIAVAA